MRSVLQFILAGPALGPEVRAGTERSHLHTIMNSYNARRADTCDSVMKKECQLFGQLITKGNSLGLFNKSGTECYQE